MAHSRSKILQLYKNLIKESSKFEAYNYRFVNTMKSNLIFEVIKQLFIFFFSNYALRRIRDGFKENKNVSDVDQISKLIEKAENNLNIIKRQALLSQVYSTDKLVIEKQEPHST